MSTISRILGAAERVFEEAGVKDAPFLRAPFFRPSLFRPFLFWLFIWAVASSCDVNERCSGPYCECESDADCMLTACYVYPDAIVDCRVGCTCSFGRPVSKEGWDRYVASEVDPECGGRLSCDDECEATTCAEFEVSVPACRKGRCVAVQDPDVPGR